MSLVVMNKEKNFQWNFYGRLENNQNFVDFLNGNVNQKVDSSINERHLVVSKEFNGKNYIIKRFSPIDNRRWDRKIELSIKSVFISGAEKSFRGAVWLWEAGIPGIRPVAWSSYKVGYHQVSYFVYEKIDAIDELKAFLENDLSDESLGQVLIEEMGRLSRAVHNAGYRHTDIVTHNFLVQKHADSGFKLLLIDTDKVEKVSKLGCMVPLVKLFFDLRCLRRLRFNSKDLKIFFDGYFDGKSKLIFFKMWFFWVCGGFNLYKRIKLKKRLPKEIRNLSLQELLNSDDIR